MSLLSTISSAYAGIKQTVEDTLRNWPLPEQVYSESGRIITYLSNNPLVQSSVENAVAPRIKAHLPKITAAFGFAGVVHEGSWLFSTASSAMLQVLVQKVEAPQEDDKLNQSQQQANKRRFDEQRQFVHDAAVAMMAWHALKLGSALFSRPSVGGAAGLLYDLGALVTLNEVVYNNSAWRLASAEPREKND